MSDEETMTFELRDDNNSLLVEIVASKSQNGVSVRHHNRVVDDKLALYIALLQDARAWLQS